MPSQEDIETLRERLATHRAALSALLTRRDDDGIAADIAAAREGIASCKVALRGWGVAVADLPDDMEPAPPAPSVAQRIDVSGGSVGQVIGSQVNLYYAAEGRPPDRDRLDLIAQVRRTWAGADTRLPLALEERPAAIPPPTISLQYQELRRPPHALPPGAPIAEVFDALGGALLILGAPGAGKTTLLRELCMALLDRAEAEADHPAPAIFNLSSWTTGPLDRWLVSELRSLYGVPRRLAERWVAERAVLPLLDGLDEVAGPAREACAGAINAYRSEHGGPIAVCSRISEYEALTAQLRLSAAVAVLPLTDAQVDDYLAAGGGRLAGLRAMAAGDEQLRELMRAPLLLGVADVGADALAAPQSGRSWKTALWDAYITTVLRRRGDISAEGRRELLRGLRGLARLMRDHGQAVFLIERIQPQWLSNRWLFALAWAGSLTLGLASLLAAMMLLSALAALTVGTAAEPGTFPLVGLFSWFLGVVALAIAGIPGKAFLAEVEPFETLAWAWRGLAFGALVWAAASAIGIWISDMGILPALLLSLIPAYVFAIGTGITGGMVKTTTRPNEGTWRALRTMGLMSYEAAVPLLFVAFSALFTGGEGLAIGAILALIAAGIGLGVGMAKGGLSVIKHVVIRTLLATAGALPWNIRRLLDAGAGRLILRRVGGGYEFIHRLLVEHLADLGDAEVERLAAGASGRVRDLLP